MEGISSKSAEELPEAEAIPAAPEPVPMEEPARGSSQEELSPAGRSRRSFLRKLLILSAGVAIVGPRALKSVAESAEVKEEELPEEARRIREQYESKEVREKIAQEFADMCAFYADTLSDAEIPMETAEDVRKYIEHALDRHLNVYSLAESLTDRKVLPAPEEGSDWAAYDAYREKLVSKMVPAERIAEARRSQKKSLGAEGGEPMPLPSVEEAILASYLLQRFDLVLEIQRTIQDKMREAGLQEVHVQNFLVDGRLGSKTLALCSNIADDEYFWDLYRLFERADQGRGQEIIQTLRSGEVTIPIPKFSKESYERVSAMYSDLKERMPVDYSLQESPARMRERFDKVGHELKKAMETAGDDHEKAKEVQIAFFNYYMDLWRGSPGRGHDGNAKYPFEPGKISDCTTFVFQIMRRLFPGLPSKIQLGYSDKQVKDYGEYFGQEPGPVAQGESEKTPAIYIVDGHGHMFIVAPDLSTGLYSICEAGEKIQSTVFFPSQRYSGINVSTPKTMHKMVGKHQSV